MIRVCCAQVDRIICSPGQCGGLYNIVSNHFEGGRFQNFERGEGGGGYYPERIFQILAKIIKSVILILKTHEAWSQHCLHF